MEISKDYLLTDTPSKTPEKINNGTATTEKGNVPDSPMIQTEIISATVKDTLATALESLGFKPTEENMKLATLLFESNLPVSKENLLKLNQSMKLNGGEEAKALFLIENNLRPNPKNATILSQLIEGEHGLGEEMKSLLQAVDQITDPEVKKILAEFFFVDSEPITPGKTVDSDYEEATVLKEAAGLKKAPQSTEINREAPLEVPSQQDDVNTNSDAPGKDIHANDTPLADNPEISVSEKDLSEKDIHIKNTPLNDAPTKDIPAEDIHTRDIPEKDIPARDINAKDIPESSINTKDNPAKDINAKDIPAKDIHLKDIPVKDLLIQEVPLKEVVEKPLHMRKLFFSPQGKNPREIDDYLNELKERLAQASEQLAKHDSPEAAKVLKQIVNIEERIEFITQMQNDVFIQLPLSIHNHETNGELFVFKDKKNKGRSQGAASALIALDTACLGRFEVYVRKDGRRVNCQFRLAGQPVENLVRENLESLSNLLEQHSYILEASSFKKLEEPFTLLQKETLPEGSDSGLRKNNLTNKISFDIRT